MGGLIKGCGDVWANDKVCATCGEKYVAHERGSRRCPKMGGYCGAEVVGYLKTKFKPRGFRDYRKKKTYP